MLLGGSLKKYNKLDLNWIFVWIILPILLFLFSMNAVYAYFTATTTPISSSVTTAKIAVGFKDTSVGRVDSSATVVEGKIVPGDTIKYVGKVINNGTLKMYAILKFSVGIGTDMVHTGYYTATGAAIAKSGDSYTTGATVIDVNATSSFELSYTISADLTQEDCEGKTLKMTVTAHAVQFANVGTNSAIDDAVEATNLLIKD